MENKIIILCQDCEMEGQSIPASNIFRDPYRENIVTERTCDYHFNIRRYGFIR